MENDHEIIANGGGGGGGRGDAPQRVDGEALMEIQGAKPLRNFSFLTSGGQINSSKYKKPSELIFI